jgi:TPR repeat protein
MKLFYSQWLVAGLFGLTTLAQTAQNNGPDPKLLAKANAGDSQAQEQLGELYEAGHGVQQDDAKAALWYRRAADQNLASAQLHLGLLYDHGNGVPQNSAQAAALYRKAALQGLPEAQYNLGTMF